MFPIYSHSFDFRHLLICQHTAFALIKRTKESNYMKNKYVFYLRRVSLKTLGMYPNSIFCASYIAFRKMSQPETKPILSPGAENVFWKKASCRRNGPIQDSESLSSAVRSRLPHLNENCNFISWKKMQMFRILLHVRIFESARNKLKLHSRRS